MMSRIVLVEDDPDWEHEAKSALEAGLPAGFRVDSIETESEFADQLETGAFERDVPSLFVMDLMLPWDTPRPDMRKAPREVVENGFYHAGVRCQKRLSGSTLAHVPVLYWTIVAKEDLEKDYPIWPGNVEYLEKKELAALVNRVKSILRLDR
jgi:CheY-like chemotaxis protein